MPRRAVVRGAVLVPTAVALGTAAPGADAVAAPPLDALGIRPRRDWTRARPGRALEPEPDVRFLLVHHTATTDGYGEDDVPAQLERIRTFHTGAEKGWPDVAYNFFVDRFGGLWEGRTGSLAGPVRADATGGNQGYAQLCCFLGDHRTVVPTPAARAAMARLLAGLAERHRLDLSPGTTATFTSRGSNRWPAGDRVTVRTVAGHRDVSRTTCPGDAAYALLVDDLPSAARRTPAPRPAPRGAPAPPPTVAGEATGGGEAGTTPILAAGAGVAAALAGGLVALRRRRT